MKRIAKYTFLFFLLFLSSDLCAFELLEVCNDTGCQHQFWDWNMGASPMPFWVNAEFLEKGPVIAAADVWKAEGNANFSLKYFGETDVAEVKHDGIHLVAGREDDVLVPIVDGVYVQGCAPASNAFSLTVAADEGDNLGEIIEKDIIICVGSQDYNILLDLPLPGEQDLWSIMAHEFGHNLGLADLYNDAQAEATMFAYNDAGDITKRSLAGDDISGIQAIYGKYDEDLDEDGVGLEADNCPSIYNPEQQDTDKDGYGDSCDMNLFYLQNFPYISLEFLKYYKYLFDDRS